MDDYLSLKEQFSASSERVQILEQTLTTALNSNSVLTAQLNRLGGRPVGPLQIQFEDEDPLESEVWFSAPQLRAVNSLLQEVVNNELLGVEMCGPALS